MTKRAATWILTVLLALSAAATVPAARAQTWGSNSAVVWIAQDRAEQRVPARPQPARVPRATSPRPQEPLVTVQPIAGFLYQRPPPFSFR